MDSILLYKADAESLFKKRFSCDCKKTHFLNTRLYCAPKILEQIANIVMNNLGALNATILCEKEDVELAEHIKELLIDKLECNISVLDEFDGLREDKRLLISIGSLATNKAKEIATKKDVRLIAVVYDLSVVSYEAGYSDSLADGIGSVESCNSPDILIVDKEIIEQKLDISCVAFMFLSCFMDVFEVYAKHYFDKREMCSKVCDMLIVGAELGIDGVLNYFDDKDYSIEVIIEAFLRIEAAKTFLCVRGVRASSLLKVAGLYRQLSKDNGVNDRNSVLVVFIYIMNIYKLFLKNPILDTAMPPDVNSRYEKFLGCFNMDEAQAKKLTSKIIEPETYNMRMFILEQEREFFKDAINTIEERHEIITSFLKEYVSDFDSYKKLVDKENLKTAIVLSTEINNEFTFLDLIRDLGLLEGYLN